MAFYTTQFICIVYSFIWCVCVFGCTHQDDELLCFTRIHSFSPSSSQRFTKREQRKETKNFTGQDWNEWPAVRSNMLPFVVMPCVWIITFSIEWIQLIYMRLHVQVCASMKCEGCKRRSMINFDHRQNTSIEHFVCFVLVFPDRFMLWYDPSSCYITYIIHFYFCEKHSRTHHVRQWLFELR